MAGINTLQEIYKKRGEEWTKNFLSSELRITEKSDAYRFSFEASRQGKLRFYGKNAEEPLNRIDRTVSDLYEGAISKIEKLPEAILINIPKSHRFGFNWLPESGLTLTDITIRQGGKAVKQIQEKEVIERWALLFHVKHGDELHNGYLTESKVTELMASLKNGTAPLLEKDSSKTYILKNDKGIAKIAQSNTKTQKIQKSHTFDLLLLQIHEHIQTLDLEKFTFRSNRPDERYLEIVCETFNRFVNTKGAEFLEMGIKKPGFLEKSGKFNRRWIRNEKTLSILESNHNYEYLLSIFLTNLRKPKKAVGLLTESFVENYNRKIYEIVDLVKNTEDYGFPEFNSILERDIEDSPAPEKQEDFGDGFSGDEHLRAVGMMQTYFSRPFANTNEEASEDVVEHNCNVLLINMGQFTNRLLSECERIMQLTGNGFVLIHDENAGNSCLWGLPKNPGRLAAQQMVKSHPHLFECYESLSVPNLQKIQKAAGERKINTIYTGRSCEFLQKEYESYVTVLGGYIGEKEIMQLKGNSDKEIQECMEKEDFAKFKDIFPEGIQKFWSNMQSEWLAKAYH